MGAGKVTAALPSACRTSFISQVPESMLLNTADNAKGCIDMADIDTLSSFEPSAWLIGPGMGRDEETMELIREIRETGMSIIIIEHVMKAIMNLSDRIVVINQGKKIAEGLPAEIAANEEVIESYLGGGKKN